MIQMHLLIMTVDAKLHCSWREGDIGKTGLLMMRISSPPAILSPSLFRSVKCNKHFVVVLLPVVDEALDLRLARRVTGVPRPLKQPPSSTLDL